ncbi:hypothetical protein BOTBODRAFT_171014 [Botryobasidium botryosum FD-172 SS1]|uniref:Uncharacterized protein n=1 Tax=Botryobasidium botryosum (strain FD-172 SS1) TaxID=930990 RepID=A0A067N4I6_BOTB1|nr:hypothetical protein BOTBODRAFT_171014 [Botryobasidium botryosum FD-172 SS1]
MRFGAILSVLSLGLVAFAAPTAHVQESAIARRAPVEVAAREVVAPVARSTSESVEDFINKLQSVKSELDCVVEEIESNNQYKSVRSNDEWDWEGTFNTVTVQLNVVVNVFTDCSFVSEIDVQEIAELVAAIIIDIVIILYAALKASTDCNDYISSTVTIVITICGSVTSDWSSLCSPIYEIINSCSYTEYFGYLNINISTLLKISSYN